MKHLLPLAALLTLNAQAASLPPVHAVDPLLAADRTSQSQHRLWLPAFGTLLQDEQLDLDAGESTSLQLPADSLLRLQIDGDQPPPALWLSSDGQLWQQGRWLPGAAPGQWLQDAAAEQPRLVRLQAAGALAGQLWQLRRQRIDLPARRLALQDLQPALPAVQLQAPDGSLESAVQLPAGQPVSAVVAGPALLAIGSRPLPGSDGSDPAADYSLQWSLDESAWQSIDLSQPAASATWQQLDQCALQGDLQRRYLAIGPGTHRLQLQAAQPLALTLEQADPQPLLHDEAGEPFRARLQAVLDTPAQLARLNALRQSNHLLDAPGAVLQQLQSAAGSEPDLEIDALRQQIERSQRFYRNLLPQHSQGTMQPAWFATEQPFDPEPRRYLPASARIGGLSRGLFVHSAGQPLDYALPARNAPSELRLALALPAARDSLQLQVQFDDQPAQPLHLLPSTTPASSAAQAALVALGTPLPTLGAAFASQQQSGHFWRVASAQLHLPPQVRRVRISSSQPVSLALQYRASLPYYASEQAYAGWLQQLPAHNRVSSLHAALRRAESPDSDPLPLQPDATRALHNQWHPLLRWLHALQASGLDDFSHSAPLPPPVAERARRLASASNAARRQDWPAVLEALGTLGHGHDADALRLSRQALLALGESALARRQLLAAALLGPDQATATLARQHLLQEARATADSDEQLRLLAALFLRSGDAGLLEPLGQALLDSGEPRWAAQIGVLLASLGNSPPWLAEAAWQTGWPLTLEQALQRLPAPEQALQRGELAARAGQTRQALHYWQSAGAEGARRSLRLQQASAIAHALHAAGSASRQHQVQRWLEWSLDAAQPHQWQPLTDQVLRAAGHHSLYSEISQHSLQLPRASAGTPVELEVVGPATLRLQVRQLGSAQDDWLLARIGEQTLHYPLLARASSTYLQAGEPATAVSQLNEVLLPVPAGLQRIQLTPRRQDILLQIAQWQPAHHWAVLPPVTPLTLRAALAGPPAAGVVEQAGTFWQRPPATRYLQVSACRVTAIARVPASQLYTAPLDSAGAAAGLVQLRPRVPAVLPAGWPAGSTAVDLQQPPGDGSDEALLHQAIRLLWQVEDDSDPRDDEAGVMQIAALAAAHPQLPLLQQLSRRADAGYHWEPQLSAFDSAGVRPLPQHSRMQSPWRRVRQALMPAAASEALWLQGREVQGIDLFSPEPARLVLELQQAALPYSQPVAAQVMLQLDDQPARVLAMTTGSRQLDLPLPAGAHALRLWLQQPQLQQLVLVRVQQAGNATLAPDERSWHIAAPGQPASFRIQGPALLRIEEWSAHGSQPQYRHLEAGWHSIELPAASDGSDRYYRLASLRAGDRQQPLPASTWHAALPQAAPPSLPPAAAQPVRWQLQDRFPPGEAWRSLGTHLTLADRGDGPEEDSSSARYGRHVELGLSYRLRSEDPLLYSRSDLLLRQLQSGDQVLGLRQWLDYYPPRSPWQLGALAEAWLQPGDIAGLADPWSAHLQLQAQHRRQLGRDLDNELRLSLDQYWLGAQDPRAAQQARLDPDIHTPYRDEHRNALTLADRLTWYPWLDQRLYAETALVSNPDFTLRPDHLRLNLAAAQLIGPLSVEAGLRWRRYLADDERDSAFSRKRLYVRLSGLRWGQDSNALHLRSELSWDPDARMLAWQVSLGADDHAGGLSPAQRPDEVDFFPVRRALQREHVDTNLLNPVLP